MARLTRDTDDSLISGEEFRVRRLALQLEQPVVMQTLGVNRSTMDKWQRGYVMVPREAREMLEMAEGDVEAMVQHLVETSDGQLDSAVPGDWPWGEGTWFIVVARARWAIAEAGGGAVIKGPSAPPEPESEPEPTPRKKRKMIIDPPGSGPPPHDQGSQD